MNEPIAFSPIGTVHNAVAAPDKVRWEEIISRVEIAEELQPALDGIEEFSHIVIIYAFDRQPPGPLPLRVHPERRADLPLVGVLATRSPRRPNPIGVTTVELLERAGNVLTVRGLDALDGTPVLDIKPYLVRGDRIAEARTPAWLQRLWARHDEERGDG